MFAGSLLAQQKNPETTSTVPALEEFHTVIFSLWHTAWPNKDTDMMEKLLPDVERSAAAVIKATLPGILREKTLAWQAGTQRLGEAVKAYRNAVGAQDKEKLLAATEQLHRQYEGLVRIIRPVLKELDAFHAVLYMMYHHSWPDGDMPKLRESADSLTVRMMDLEKAVLPKRLEAKFEPFQAARTKLGSAVKALQELFGPGRDAPAAQEIRVAVTGVHSSYLALEKVFE